MLKKALTCFVIFCFCFLQISLVSGQNFQWAFANGTAFGGDEGTSLAVDDSGNVYTATHYNNDVAIFKNDTMGNQVWFDYFSGFIDVSSRSPAMTIDNDGNLYLTGHFQNTLDFDPGASVYNMTTTGAGSAYLIKLDANGSFIWAKMINGNGALVKGTDIQFSENGFIVLAGYCNGTIDYDPGSGVSNSSFSGGITDAFVVKLDTAGNFVWGADFGGTGICYSFGMSLDATDNVIVSGYFYDTADFDPGPAVYTMIAGTTANMYILKLNPSGNFVWAQCIEGGITSTICFAVDSDPVGNVYAAGYFSDTCDFDPGTGVYLRVSNGGSDCYLVKLDFNGNFAWAATFGGPFNDEVKEISYSNQGAVIATGNYLATADFDPGLGTFNLVANYSDAFLLSLDTNSNFINAKSIGGNGWDIANAVLADSIGNIYVTGYFVDTVDFNPPFQYNLISNGAGDIYTIKYGPLNVGVQEVNESNNFNVYPNPGNGNYTFEFDDFYSGEYEISNLLGEQIKTGTFESSKIMQCDIDGAAGIYFVNLIVGKKIFKAKIVKN